MAKSLSIHPDAEARGNMLLDVLNRSGASSRRATAMPTRQGSQLNQASANVAQDGNDSDKAASAA